MTNARARAAAALIAVSVAAGCARQSPTESDLPFAPTFTEEPVAPSGVGFGSGNHNVLKAPTNGEDRGGAIGSGNAAQTEPAAGSGETAAAEPGGPAYVTAAATSSTSEPAPEPTSGEGRGVGFGSGN